MLFCVWFSKIDIYLEVSWSITFKRPHKASVVRKEKTISVYVGYFGNWIKERLKLELSQLCRSLEKGVPYFTPILLF